MFMYIISLSHRVSFKFTHPMSLNAVAEVSAVLGVPISAVPIGLALHGTVQSFRPKSKLKKWSKRIEHISAVVVSKGDMITHEEMEEFLRMLEL